MAMKFYTKEQFTAYAKQQIIENNDLVKAHIKLKKAEQYSQYSRKSKYIIYDFGEDLPTVNAEYLLDILTAFPEARAYKKAGQAGIIDAIYFEAEGGDGVLLPLRK